MSDGQIIDAMIMIGDVIDNHPEIHGLALEKLNDAWNILNRLIGKWPQ